MSNDEVLRRVQDLLVGDVIAHEGHARTVRAVFWDQFNELRERAVVCVIFEDTPWVPKKRTEPEGPKVQRPERITAGTRLLLLESHYSTRSE